jgi:hypothetical protein
VSTELGEAFYEELLWVHSMLRQELELVRSLAARVADGLSPEELRIEVAALKANGPLWALKVNCLHYCRFVHGHHRLEDIALFPALRSVDPDISPVVDRLEADHRVVAAQLEEIEAAVAGHDQERVIAALDALADHLLEHLAFEEESIGPTLRRMDRHPLWS